MRFITHFHYWPALAALYLVYAWRICSFETLQLTPMNKQTKGERELKDLLLLVSVLINQDNWLWNNWVICPVDVLVREKQREGQIELC